MLKRLFYGAAIGAAAAVVLLGCGAQENDNSVRFVIDNQSSYDLTDVKISGQDFTTALPKKILSASAPLESGTGKTITFKRQDTGDVEYLIEGVSISIRDDRYTIWDDTDVALSGGRTVKLGKLAGIPSYMRVSGASSTSVTISWDIVSGAEEYYIYRSSNADGEYFRLPTAAAITETSYTDTELPSGATYYYKAAAKNADGESEKSIAVAGVVIPAVLSQVSATAASSSSVTLTWSAVTGATEYYIYRETSENGAYDTRLTTAAAITGTSYTDSGLPSNTTYYYKVAVKNDGGTGDQSSEVSATTLLTPPLNVSATAASSSSVTISWSAVTGAAEYYIYRETNENGAFTTRLPTAVAITGTSYTDATVSSSAAYYYKVAAYNSAGVSALSEYSSGAPYILRTTTFDADGGSPATQTKTVIDGGSLGSSMPTEPTRSGYVFGGWYTETNGGGTAFTASTVVNANITVYAKWVYTITFDADGGSPATQTKTVLDGGTLGLSMPSNPTKSGAAFEGWYTAQSGGGVQFTASTAITANITVYAKWICTITFDADGGSPETQTKTVLDGGTLGLSTPSNPARGGYVFEGWYTARNGGGVQFTESTTVTANRTVYAKWTIAQMPSDLSLAASLAWLIDNALEGNDYTITVKSNESLAPQTLFYNEKKIGVTLEGGDSERWVVLNSNGALFTVDSGVTLTLGDNITLQGRSSNTSTLIIVHSGGALTMNTGSKITGNSYSGLGGAMVLYGGGTFTMNGGTISGNSAGYGGGVNCGGMFIMNGGEISGNSAGRGGAMCVGGVFLMNGGKISGNTATDHGGVAFAGGVYVSGGTFTMSGGEISGNTANATGFAFGGGVGVDGGAFIMNGGKITGNATSNTNTSTGTDSSYNYACGGGVGVKKGTFTMTGGEISANTAYSIKYYYSYGGGVGVRDSGTFIKQSGGIIYGSDADTGLKNAATGNTRGGHAVYVNISPDKKRNSTAGSGVTLNSGISGSAGGWQ
ncbi:MAG: InlB B-repeat-containing protein [Treponema sp.]|jgi:uncharacterized repeat protein (TIGR02543 family)|nr:InlB B-repeat-containing protein [Treponema sp.]